MVLSVVIAAVLGALASRSIVAVSDTHRLDLPDRWFAPVCPACGTRLRATLASCSGNEHSQRRSNTAVLGATIVLSGYMALAAPSPWLLPAYLVFLWAMILLTATDLDTKLIPNRMLGPGTLIGGVLLVTGHFLSPATGDLLDAAIGGVAYFGVKFLLALLVRGGLGFGDVKLAFLIGVFTGYLGLGHVVLTGIGAYILGGVGAAFLLVTRKQGRKDAIPFGPFMTMAAVLTIFFGSDIIAWYLQ